MAQSTSVHIGVSSPNFVRFWSGQTVATFGMRLGTIALPVVAVQLLSASEKQVGYLGAFASVAFLLVGLPAGAWVDRWLKRPTMMIANLVRGLAAMLIPVLYLLDQLQIWHLYLVAAIIGFATVFFDVAYQSYLPILVPLEQIGTANSRMEATAQLAMTAGPALGGLLLKVVSAPLLLLGTGLGYLFSFVATWKTVDNEHQQRVPDTGQGLWRDVKQGLAFSVHNPVVSRIIWGNAISATGSTMVFTLLPVLVLRTLGMDGFTYGLIMTAGAVGGVVGAMLTSRLLRRFSEGSLIPWALFITTAATVILPAAAYVHGRLWQAGLLMVGMAIMNLFSLIYNIAQVSLRQRLCPRELLGRMNASIRWIVWGLWPLPSLAAGWLGEHWGLLPTLWLGAGSSVLAVFSQLRMGYAISSVERSAPEH
ncbi:MAG: MFS transporter [Propionibacteriaceae bacterium]